LKIEGSAFSCLLQLLINRSSGEQKRKFDWSEDGENEGCFQVLSNIGGFRKHLTLKFSREKWTYRR